MKAELITRTQTYIKCPHCGDTSHRICHLFDRECSFGPWWCDGCGGSFIGRVSRREVTVEKRSAKKRKTTVFLRREDVVLAVKGFTLDGFTSRRTAFFYEEHSCPSNYLQDVTEVFDLTSGEIDPHGLFDFVCEVPEMKEEDFSDFDIHKFLKQVEVN